MNFQKISKKMKESKIVKAYIYLWLVVILLFGIGAFIYMNSKGPFSLEINILVSIAFVIIISVGFLFKARFLLLAGFIEGNKKTIKFQMGVVAIALVAVLIFYNTFLERWGIILFFAILIISILIILFNFLRLKELNNM